MAANTFQRGVACNRLPFKMKYTAFLLMIQIQLVPGLTPSIPALVPSELCTDESPKSIATTIIDFSDDLVGRSIVETSSPIADDNSVPVNVSNKRKPTLSLRNSHGSDAHHYRSDVGSDISMGFTANCPGSSSDAFFNSSLDSCSDSLGSLLHGMFGLPPNSVDQRSLNSNPIESFADSCINHESLTDDETFGMRGGGAPADDEFQANKADINKTVQNLKSIKHGFAPKQIRMLLVSDSKFLSKIERTKYTKQLQSCVAAAAQRMGLIATEKNSLGDSALASSSTSRRPETSQSLPLRELTKNCVARVLKYGCIKEKVEGTRRRPILKEKAKVKPTRCT